MRPVSHDFERKSRLGPCCDKPFFAVQRSRGWRFRVFFVVVVVVVVDVVLVVDVIVVIIAVVVV